MKIGKARKNPAVPPSREEPPAVSIKPKKPPVAMVVAKARQSIRRVEPAPQPAIALIVKKKRLKAKAVKRAGVEPKPQPVIGAKKKSAPQKVKRLQETVTTPVLEIPPPRIAEEGSRGRSPSQPPVTEGDRPFAATVGASMPAVSRAVLPDEPPAKARTVRQPRPAPVEIPAILLEPDHVPNEPAIAGPGARFALTPATETALAAPPDELPESYGTQQIFLAARDPYCLFASWDLDARQRARYNATSASGALTIRLRRGFVEGPIVLEVHAAPNSRDRFIQVGQPDTTFVAELGFHEKNTGLWRNISVSKPVTTPRDRMAPAPVPAVTAAAATVSSETAVAPVAPPSEPEPIFESQPRRDEIIFAMQAPPPPVESRWIAPQESESWWVAKQEPEPFRERPRWLPPKEKPRWSPPKRVPAPRWSPTKTKQLDELISLEFRRMQHGSLEIEELLRRSILRERELEAPSSLELLEEELPPEEMVAERLGLAQPGLSSLELAAAGGEARKGFWFKVNAELIIYGSTEPDAHVSIGGRPIRLRQDGTFSYRFALPDGAYELPVIAIARDGHDGRAADLRFSRASRYSGDVPPHPHDPALKAPSVENL